MQLLACCVLVQVLASSTAYEYYQQLTFEKFVPPVALPEDAYFGYSITYDQVKKSMPKKRSSWSILWFSFPPSPAWKLWYRVLSKVISSAPRADLEGQVFTCDIRTKNCAKMTFKQPTTRLETSSHHFWSGATVKADSQNLLVCAPRYTDRMMMRNGSPHDGTCGRCYMKKLASPNDQLISLSQIKTEDRQIGSTHNENLTDSFGWSIDIAEDNSVRVGSPALASGRVMTYKKPSPIVAPELINGFKSEEKVSFNFGYSIASGYFFDTKFYHFAVSTPYGEEGAGKVLFFQSNKQIRGDGPLKVHWSIKDSDVDSLGSLFGASLCSANLTPKKSALLIGAPAYFADENRYHTGRVHLYFPSRRSNAIMTLKRKIEGLKDGGFFGYAIANIGDMDKDGLDEIVIAAPYEDDGKGAVYLYPGSVLASEKAQVTPMQRFQPEDVWSFGLSLSPLKDATKSCNDLAIGAPGNDTVVMYHCIPCITANARLVSKLEERTDKKSFMIESCLKSKIAPNLAAVTAKVKVTVQITHPHATFDHINNHKYEYKGTLSTNNANEVCQPIKVLTPEDGDYDQDILLNLNMELLNDPAQRRTFEPSAGTLCWQSVLIHSLPLRAADCRGKICTPQLSVAVGTSAKSPYITGSSTSETLQVVVSNGGGDAAYRPCARVVVQGDASLLRAPAQCPGSDDPRARTCQLPRTLASDSSWDIGNETAITMDMTALTSHSEPVVVTVDVFNRCNMSEAPADSKSIAIPLEHSCSGVRVDGKSDQGEIMSVTKVNIRDIGVKTQHKYTITNAHGTNWIAPQCKIWLKKEPYIKYEFPIRVYRKESLDFIPCNLGPHSDTDESFTLECDVGYLFNKDIITIYIGIFSPPGALEGFLLDEQSKVTVQTKIDMYFDSKNGVVTKSITTTLTLQEATVPLWIIIAAGLVGLLIVILIAFALRECGLLRRKNNEKLQELKTEVKRKSMALQRQSVRMPHGLTENVMRNRTYRELLDAAEAEEAHEALGATRRASLSGSRNNLI